MEETTNNFIFRFFQNISHVALLFCSRGKRAVIHFCRICAHFVKNSGRSCLHLVRNIYRACICRARKIFRTILQGKRKLQQMFRHAFRRIYRGCVHALRVCMQLGRHGFRRVYRWFIRTGRKICQWFIRTGRRIGRWFIRQKRSLVRFVKRKEKRESIEIFIATKKRKVFLPLLSDTKYFEKIKPLLDQIPESNGGRFYEPYSCKIAIVADEFLYDSYQGIADFVYITPETYKEIANQVDFLLIVTAWRGLNNEWRQMGTIGTPANQAIHEAISYYKDLGKTIVFYSKEDPPNYAHFLPIAKRCDIIFTSAYEKISDYIKDCGTSEVYSMCFGINPLYHNPIGIRKFPKKKEIIFSGSWVKKYPERIRALGMIFDGVLAAKRKLKIIDRNYDLPTYSFFFPQKYYRYISPAISHDYLQKTHKLYNWAININSVIDSETMFANRVYELQATGNLMLSNESIGVERQFPEVMIVRKKEDVKAILDAYSDEDVYEHQMAGVRRVMTGETTFDRVGDLISKVGLSVTQPRRKILVLARGNSEILMAQFHAQTYQEKAIVMLNQVTSADWESCDMVTIWDENRTYGKYYLEDMINGFKYTSCDYICKDAFYQNGQLIPGTEHDYVNQIKDIFAVVFWKDTISMEELNSLLKEKNIERKNGYCIDHFNFSA